MNESENILNDDNNLYLSPVQRGIINTLLRSAKPLSLVEIFHSFSKRPCAKKLIPQIVNLKTKGFLICKSNSDNCMDFEFHLTDKGRKLIKGK